VLSEVPADSTCVGVPARVVKQDGKRVYDLDQVRIPDPVSMQMCTLSVHIQNLENKLHEMEEKMGGKD